MFCHALVVWVVLKSLLDQLAVFHAAILHVAYPFSLFSLCHAECRCAIETCIEVKVPRAW